MELTDKQMNQMIDDVYEEIKKKFPHLANLGIEQLAKNLIGVTISWLEVQGYLDIKKVNKQS